MRVIAYNKRPKCLQTDLISGLFVGGCIEDYNSPTKSKIDYIAHAHVLDNDPYKNWICVIDKNHLKHKELMLHELAHVLTGQGHTDYWRKVLLNIGGTLDEIPDLLRSYHKISRKKI